MKLRPIPSSARFQSTLSLRRATFSPVTFESKSAISIHALLAESDRHPRPHQRKGKQISIHALLAESDHGAPGHLAGGSIFQSTLSLRRATLCSRRGIACAANFNPRSPCGERPSYHGEGLFSIPISIHALLAESDLRPSTFRTVRVRFQSTLSLRRATLLHRTARKAGSNFNPRSPCGERHNLCPRFRLNYVISIHALLAESDSKYHQIGPIVSV